MYQLVFLLLLLIAYATANIKPSIRTCASKSEQQLDLFIKTGDVRFAGTDDPISIAIRGSNGRVCRLKQLNNWGNDRERGQTDHYIVCCNQTIGYGPITHISFQVNYRPKNQHHHNNIVNDWFIAHIKIESNGKVLFDMEVNKWAQPRKYPGFGYILENNNEYSIIRA